MAKNKKIVRYKKPWHMNIGVIIFLVIFVYLSYFVYQYFTTEHVSVYEVEQGKIAQDRDYTGLILRDETVYYADKAGSIHYFIQDGSKAKSKSYVYTIDETGEFYKANLETMNGNTKLNQRNLDQLRAAAHKFTLNYSDAAFYQVYNFSFDMQAELKESLTQAALDGYAEELLDNSKLHISRTERSGIVAYYVDGLESLTADNITQAMFDQAAYRKNHLFGKKEVKKNDPVYKMINSERWSIVIPISPEIKQQLAGQTELGIRFKKDHSTAVAAIAMLQKEAQDYLLLTMEHSVIRFAGERFIEVELLLKELSGLKIPNTAILEKDFFVVPMAYITKGGNSKQNGVIKETLTREGEKKAEFIAVEPFFESEDGYYIDHEELVQGDTILMPDAKEKLTLGRTASLPGVYNINKGYAVFKRIEVISQNKEYTIIQEKTEYGLSVYDHIALDSSILKEHELIK